jgi:hypothetical protein
LKAAKEVFDALAAAGLTGDDLECPVKITLFLGKISCLEVPEDTPTIIRGSFVDWNGGKDQAEKELKRGCVS